MILLLINWCTHKCWEQSSFVNKSMFVETTLTSGFSFFWRGTENMIQSAILFMQEFGLPETSHRQRRSEFIAKNNPIANESLNFESTHTIATHTHKPHTCASHMRHVIRIWFLTTLYRVAIKIFNYLIRIINFAKFSTAPHRLSQW